MKRVDRRSILNAVVLSVSRAFWVPAAIARGQHSVPVEGQPLGANVRHVFRAIESLGTSLSDDTAAESAKVRGEGDVTGLQQRLDPHVLLTVTINPEERVKVGRGAAQAVLQQGGYTPIPVKVSNEAATTRRRGSAVRGRGPSRRAGAADPTLLRDVADYDRLRSGSDRVCRH